MARSPRSGAPTRIRPNAPARPASARAGASSGAVARAEAEVPKRRTNPLQFFREVRTEARKISWTSWKETWITSVMVLIMVVLAAFFFFTVDTGLRLGVQFLLSIPGRFS